jgi:hypothetical protein
MNIIHPKYINKKNIFLPIDKFYDQWINYYYEDLEEMYNMCKFISKKNQTNIFELINLELFIYIMFECSNKYIPNY